MKKPLCLALVCALAATACSHTREPTDAQLATFLQSNHAQPGPKAPLDAHSVDCLRAWSDDADLLKGLSPTVTGEDGKKACRTTLDTRLADATRNPAKFTFADVTAPKVAARAVALQQARMLAEMADPAAREHQPPAAFTHPDAAAPPPLPAGSPFVARDPNVDLGLAGTRLHEAQDLCVQTQQAARAPGAKDALVRYAAFCVGNLRRLQMTLEMSARKGHTEQLGKIGSSAEKMSTIARNLLAGGGK